MAEDLVKRLREAHANSTQRILGSDIFEAAADLIEQQAASLAELNHDTSAMADEIQRLETQRAIMERRAEQAERALAEARTELGEARLVLEQTERNAARVISEAVEVLRPFADNMPRISDVERARAFVAQHSDSRGEVRDERR